MMHRDVVALPLSLALCCVASAGATTTLYTLTGASEFAQGCFPPCMCPLLVSTGMTGTFKLVDDESNPLFSHFLVEGFDCVVSLGSSTKHIVGSGTYVYGGEVAYLQRMELDLSIDGAALQHFDSGWVPFEQWPPTIDLAISINGMYCIDTVLWIHAAPIPPNPYDLDGDGSVSGGDLAILLGAWGPCSTEPCAGADFNGDGTVSGADLSLLLGAWAG
jgi:Dockerin type I domain